MTEKGAYNMAKLLRDTEDGWRKSLEYKDVEATYWVPGQFQVDKCPQGCQLLILNNGDWGDLDNYDAYCQTRVCRAHGFARIYVITGPAAKLNHWSPPSKKNGR